MGRKKGRAGKREERKKDGGKGEKEKEGRKKKRQEGGQAEWEGCRGERRDTQVSWHCALLELMNSVSNTPMQIYPIHYFILNEEVTLCSVQDSVHWCNSLERNLPMSIGVLKKNLFFDPAVSEFIPQI